jgi:hypothetical protein
VEEGVVQDVLVDDHVPVHGEGAAQDGPVDEHEDNEQVLLFVLVDDGTLVLFTILFYSLMSYYKIILSSSRKRMLNIHMSMERRLIMQMYILLMILLLSPKNMIHFEEKLVTN